MSYAYDDVNRVSAITSPKPGGGTDTVSDSRSDTANPRTETMTLPGGVTQRVDRDLAGKPMAIEVKNSGGSSLRKQAYSYDVTAGSTTLHTNVLQSMLRYQSGAIVEGYDYFYDGQGHLEQALLRNSGGVPVYNYEYTYDKANNRLTRVTGLSPNTGRTTYRYNANNQLCWAFAGTTTNGCGAPPSGATTYTYDANGNQTTGGNGYDILDRATTLGSASAGYLSPGNAELVSYGTSAFHNNALGVSRLTTGGVTTDVVRDPQGAPVSQRTTSGKQFFLSDRLGSTIGLTESTGAIVREYTYDPDGNATSTGSGATTDLRYAGGRVVGGYYHYAARYYHPDTMRWTQQDPLNQISDLAEANRYAYVGGDPLNAVDPSGEGLVDTAGKAVGTVSKGAGVVSGAGTVYCYLSESSAGSDTDSVKDDFSDAGECLNPASAFSKKPNGD